MRETIIKVVQNITHGEIIRDPQDRMTLSGLSSALNKCPLVQKLVVFDEIESAILTAQLLHLSAHLPIIVFHNNLKKLPEISKITEEHVLILFEKGQEFVKAFETKELKEKN